MPNGNLIVEAFRYALFLLARTNHKHKQIKEERVDKPKVRSVQVRFMYINKREDASLVSFKLQMERSV